MPLAKVLSCAVAGLDGELVEVEVDIASGMPAFAIVGLPDTAVQEAKERVRSAVDDALKKAFRPEFLNRLDETIIFDPLTRDDIHQIVELMARAVQTRLVEQGIGVELTDAAKEWLAKEGYDPIFGARPLRRAVQRYVENPLANRILSGEFTQGDTVLVDVDEASTALTFSKTPAAEEAGRA